MAISAQYPITELLIAWREGDAEALDRLTLLVYDDLHKLAKNAMRRERRDHTLQTTAIVNELFLQLMDRNQIDWKSRDHFFALCARLMRRILVNYARKHHAGKRGGSAVKLSLEDIDAPAEVRAAGLIALDD